MEQAFWFVLGCFFFSVLESLLLSVHKQMLLAEVKSQMSLYFPKSSSESAQSGESQKE